MRKIILNEDDHDILCVKLEGAAAITELLISDSGNSNWADDTVKGGLGALAMMLYEITNLAKKGEVAA